MPRRTGRRWTVIVAGAVLWLSAAPAIAETFAECAERAYAQNVAAAQDWQRGLRDLIVKAKPELATLATLAMEQQLAFIDRNQARLSYLARTDASRIRTREGLMAFRNLDWTDADALILRQQRPSYAALERRVADLGGQTKAHRDWPTLQEYMRAAQGVNPEFEGLLTRFKARESAIEPLLRGCRPPAP